MPTARRIRNSWGPRAGVWFDGGGISGDYAQGKSIVCARTAQADMWCLLLVHPLNAPLKGKTFEQSQPFILSEIGRAKSPSFVGMIFDLESQLWSVAAIEWIGAQCRAAGVLSYGAPKATRDPGGKTIQGGDIKKNAALFDKNFHGLMLWSFGSHTVHLAAAKALYAAGYNGEIALAHDLWRDHDDYHGLTEGPLLMSACLAKDIPAIVFQPQYAAAAAKQQLARFAVNPVTLVNPVTPPSLPYATTANSITLRPDFAACVSKIDVLTQVQDHLFPKWSGKDGSVPVQLTRVGNTWTLPQPLSSYPRGNRPNCYRIRLSKPPPGVPYYRSLMQTFVQDGAKPGAFEPPTTR